MTNSVHGDADEDYGDDDDDENDIFKICRRSN